MILIIAETGDMHAACVVHEIARRGGEAAVVDFGEFGRSLFLSHSVPDGVRLRDSRAGVTFSSTDIDAIWLRRPGRIDIAPLVSAPCLDFAMGEWRQAVVGWLQHHDAICVNPVRAQDLALKPVQLTAAADAGLAIPATLVSNDRREVAGFVGRFAGRTIHKAMSQRKGEILETRHWSPADDLLLDHIAVAPVMVQERIDGPADLRLTVIGETVLAARIETPAHILDSRLAEETGYAACSLDAVTELRILDLFRRLGLIFGTVDLKERADGTPVFLEINPQGQFLYIEIVTGLPVIATLAAFLHDRKRR